MKNEKKAFSLKAFHLEENGVWTYFKLNAVGCLLLFGPEVSPCSSILDRISNSIFSKTKHRTNKFYFIFSSYFFVGNRPMPACTCYSTTPYTEPFRCINFFLFYCFRGYWPRMVAQRVVRTRSSHAVHLRNCRRFNCSTLIRTIRSRKKHCQIW